MPLIAGSLCPAGTIIPLYPLQFTIPLYPLHYTLYNLQYHYTLYNYTIIPSTLYPLQLYPLLLGHNIGRGSGPLMAGYALTGQTCPLLAKCKRNPFFAVWDTQNRESINN